jgi:anti-anti-sigma regulatory factor
MEHFWTWTRNGTPVVTTPDAIDMANEDALPERLRDAAARNPVVVVDAATCETFFSLAAMRTLDSASRTMVDAGGELRIVVTKPSTRYYLEIYLEIARSDGQLRIFEDLDEALAAPQLNWKPRLQHMAA